MVKKYLQTPEEVIKALKEGKEVISNLSKFKLIDGLVVVNNTYINPCMSLLDDFWLEEKEPITEIKVGCVYTNREGSKVTVVKERKSGVFAVLVETPDTVKAVLLRKDGKVYGDKSNKYDIIDYWKQGEE